jgi:hypothetical protein
VTGQPVQSIKIGASPAAALDRYKAEPFRLVDGLSYTVPVVDPESAKMTPRRYQSAVFLAAMSHVFEHQEFNETAAIDALRLPCITF